MEVLVESDGSGKSYNDQLPTHVACVCVVVVRYSVSSKGDEY